MSDDLRASNADAENRQPIKADSYPTLMFVDVAAWSEQGTVTQFRGMRPGPYGFDQEH